MAEQAEKSYDDMSVDELEAELTRTGGVIEDDPQPEPAPEPQPEPELDPVAEVAEEVEAEPVQTEDTPTADDPPELDDRDLQLQELELRLERERAQREQADLIASRNAGKMGHLEKQLKQFVERPSPAPASDPLDYQDEPTAEPYRGQPQPPAVPSRYEDEVAELRDAHRASTVKEAYSDFLNRVAEDLTAQGVEQAQIVAEQQAIIEQISPTLKERFEPFGNLDEMGSKAVGKVTRMVLDSAYTDSKLAKIAELRRTASERRASQVSENRIVKQAAAPSGSGGRPAGEPPQKSIKDMTADEADAALNAEFGTGRGRLRQRR